VPVDSRAYADEIETGFAELYRMLMRHREALLASDGPIEAFASDPVRIILRSTKTYARLLDEGFHPDLLRDALRRDRHFDHLWASTVASPRTSRVIPFERADLWNNDVPLFRTRPDSCDLWSASGHRVPGFFDESGLDFVRRGLQWLSEDDLARQLAFIRDGISALPVNNVASGHGENSAQ
jgi:lantibiotic modifying enzyme